MLGHTANALPLVSPSGRNLALSFKAIVRLDAESFHGSLKKFLRPGLVWILCPV